MKNMSGRRTVKADDEAANALRTGAEDVPTLAVVVLTLPVVTVGLLAAARLAVLKHTRKKSDHVPLRGGVGGGGAHTLAHLDKDVALTEG